MPYCYDIKLVILWGYYTSKHFGGWGSIGVPVPCWFFSSRTWNFSWKFPQQQQRSSAPEEHGSAVSQGTAESAPAQSRRWLWKSPLCLGCSTSVRGTSTVPPWRAGGCSRCLLWAGVRSCFVSLINTSIVTRFAYLYIGAVEQVLQQPGKKLSVHLFRLDDISKQRCASDGARFTVSAGAFP